VFAGALVVVEVGTSGLPGEPVPAGIGVVAGGQVGAAEAASPQPSAPMPSASDTTTNELRRRAEDTSATPPRTASAAITTRPAIDPPVAGSVQLSIFGLLTVTADPDRSSTGAAARRLQRGCRPGTSTAAP
jgi:hypothetical protein